MKIIPKFCTPEDLEQLIELWKLGSGAGWKARGSYIFTPCRHPPQALVERARPFLLLSDTLLHMDSFFIHYVAQSALATHTDPRSVLRLNVQVVKASVGGQFVVNDEVLSMEAGDAVVFNPNTEPHGVTKLLQGERLVWSLGRTNPIKILTRKLQRAERKARKPLP